MRHTRAGKCRPRAIDRIGSVEGLPVLAVGLRRRKGCGRDDHMTEMSKMVWSFWSAQDSGLFRFPQLGESPADRFLWASLAKHPSGGDFGVSRPQLRA